MLRPCLPRVADAGNTVGAALEADTTNADRYQICQALDADWVRIGVELLRKGFIRPPPDAPAPASSTEH